MRLVLVLVAVCATIVSAFSEFDYSETNVTRVEVHEEHEETFFKLLSGAKRRRKDRVKIDKSRKDNQRRMQRIQRMEERCWKRLDAQEDPTELQEWQCQPKQVLGRVILPKKIRQNLGRVFMYHPVEVLVWRCSGACPHGYGLTQTCLPQNSTAVRKKEVVVRVHFINEDKPICVKGKVTEHVGKCDCGCGNREKKRCREHGGIPQEGPQGCSCNI